MAGTYTIDINLYSASGDYSNDESLSSRVETQQQTQNTETKTTETITKTDNSAKAIGAVTTAVAVAGMAYKSYIEVRNIVNTNRIVNMGIRGDLISAQALSANTSRNDAIVSYMSMATTPAISAAITGAIAGGPFGAFIGGLTGLAVGAVNAGYSYIKESINLSAQNRAYQANIQLSSYVQNIEREKLINIKGYYRWLLKWHIKALSMI